MCIPTIVLLYIQPFYKKKLEKPNIFVELVDTFYMDKKSINNYFFTQHPLQ